MPSMEEYGAQLAASIVAKVGESQSRILIGPARVYGDDLGIMAATGEPHGIIFLNLGEFAEDAPAYLRNAVDTLLVLRSGNSVTMDEGRAIRGALITALRLAFSHVDTYDDELDLAAAYAGAFPSAESRSVLQAMLDERAQD